MQHPRPHAVRASDPVFDTDYYFRKGITKLMYRLLKIDDHYSVVSKPMRDPIYACDVCGRTALTVKVELVAHDEADECLSLSQHPWYRHRSPITVELPWCLFCKDAYPTGTGCYHVDHHGEIFGFNIGFTPIQDQAAGS